MGTTEHTEGRHDGTDAQVEVEIVALRTGDDAVGQHIGPECLCHSQGIVKGGDGERYLVPGGLEHAGELHDALRLVVHLIENEEYPQLASTCRRP